MPPVPGAFVRVGLGSRRLIGVVWDGEGGDDSETVPEARLKPFTEVLPTPPLRPELRRFVDRVAAYTLAAPGMVLKMAIGVEEALLPPAPRRICAITAAGGAALSDSDRKTLTAARRRVLEALRDGVAGPAAELARRAGCGTSVVRGLIAAGLVAERLLPSEAPAPPAGDWGAPGPALSSDQRAAAEIFAT